MGKHFTARCAPLLIRMLGIGVLLHVYVGWRLIPAFPLSPIARGWAVGYLCLSCILIALTPYGRRLASPWLEVTAWTGLLMMGFFSSLCVLTLLRDGLLVLVWIGNNIAVFFHSANKVYSANNFHFAEHLATLNWQITMISALAVPLLALGISLIGFVNARRRAHIVTVDIPVNNLAPALAGFTLVQISDIHVGATIKRGYVQAIVHAVNQCHADLIAITGDVVDGSVAQLAPHTAPLAHLNARYGTYVVTGNHEYYSGAESWIQEFERLGLHVLLNRHVVITHEEARLVLAGVTDYNAATFDPTQRSDPQRALLGAPADASVRILLAHQPRTAFSAEPAGYTLQLSGHTHGGQFLPWNFFVRLQQPYTAGLKKLGKMWVYTSRGTGYWGPPKRVGAPSEITCLRLVPA